MYVILETKKTILKNPYIRKNHRNDNEESDKKNEDKSKQEIIKPEEKIDPNEEKNPMLIENILN